MIITTRKAQPSDIGWILAELKNFSEFIKLEKHSLYGDEEYSKSGLLNIIENHVMFVAESNEMPMGFIGGIYTPHLFNPNIKIQTELFWWVIERYRMSKVGLMLLNHFIEHGKQTADLVTMTLEHNSPINEKTLLKRGFRLHERSYLIEV